MQINTMYLGVNPSFHDSERIIAGEIILDIDRKAYNIHHEKEWIHLEPELEFYSGSLGFIDFIQSSKDIYIQNMGVEPIFRGNGVGKQLINSLELLAKERNIDLLTAQIDSQRAIFTYTFFDKLGFALIKNSKTQIYKRI